MKRYDKAIGRNIPPLGKITDKIQVLVIFNQSIVDESCNRMGRGIRRKNGDECRRLTYGPFDEGVAIGRRGRLARRQRGGFLLTAGCNEKEE